MNKFILLLLLTLSFLSPPVLASVFENSSLVPANPADGRVHIPICIVDESSVIQKKNVLIHDSNPSLDDVVAHMKNAVQSAWGRYNTIEFSDWRRCSVLNDSEKAQAVGVYIHPDVTSSSACGYACAKGQTSVEHHGAQMKPWGGGG